MVFSTGRNNNKPNYPSLTKFLSHGEVIFKVGHIMDNKWPRNACTLTLINGQVLSMCLFDFYHFHAAGCKDSN